MAWWNSIQTFFGSNSSLGIALGTICKIFHIRVPCQRLSNICHKNILQVPYVSSYVQSSNFWLWMFCCIFHIDAYFDHGFSHVLQNFLLKQGDHRSCRGYSLLWMLSKTINCDHNQWFYYVLFTKLKYRTEHINYHPWSYFLSDP